MSRLYEKYFGPKEDDEQQTDEAAALDRGRIGEFLRAGYMADFKAFLDKTAETASPAPGAHADMLYQSGVRDGVKLVLQELDRLERIRSDV